MDVTGKLVELLKEIVAIQECGFGDPRPTYETVASYLISHGVTVQEWISVKDRLPEPETNVIAFVGDYIDILSYKYDRRGNLAFMYMDDSGWWYERIRPSVTHWMPLPQPPKGE